MIDQEFVDAYRALIIKQYHSKPKARAEIELLMGMFSKNYTLLKSFNTEFDVDLAKGAQLDIIGRIVGVNRIVPFALPKVYFGFSDNPDARNFADAFNAAFIGGEMKDSADPSYSDLELNDSDYRVFIKAKIAVNWSSSLMDSDERISVNDAIQAAFEGDAYALDNHDMSLDLYVSPGVDLSRINVIKQLGLLPKGQGVQYKNIIQADPIATFGFADNMNAKGFADAFDPAFSGGVMANLVI